MLPYFGRKVKQEYYIRREVLIVHRVEYRGQPIPALVLVRASPFSIIVVWGKYVELRGLPPLSRVVFRSASIRVFYPISTLFSTPCSLKFLGGGFFYNFLKLKFDLYWPNWAFLSLNWIKLKDGFPYDLSNHPLLLFIPN